MFGGIGAAAVGSFAIFAVQGRAAESALATSCAPFCTHADSTPIERDYLLADASLGVAIVSLGAALVIALWPKPAEER